MPKATKAAWRAQRLRWERDEAVTVGDVARALGVSSPSVSQMLKREGWTRVAPLTIPESLSQAVATIRETPLSVLAETDVLDISVARRVEVLNKQREGARRWREAFPVEEMAKDDKIAKRARAVADALAAIGDVEASAWGLQNWSDGLPTLGQESQMQQAAVLPPWVEPQRLSKAREQSVEALEAPDAPTPLPHPEKTLPAQPPQLADPSPQRTEPLHVPANSIPQLYDDPFRPASSWHDGPNRPATGVLRDHRRVAE